MSDIHSKLAIAILLLGAAVSCTGNKSSDDFSLRYKVSGSDVIIDASDLLDEIPRHDLVMSAPSLGVDWLYNDFAIQFRTHSESMQSNYLKYYTYPESGTYYLYVRAIGSKQHTYGQYTDGFRLRLNDAYVDGTFGRGGHSREIARRGGTVLGIDRDDAAVESAARIVESL